MASEEAGQRGGREGRRPRRAGRAVRAALALALAAGLAACAPGPGQTPPSARPAPEAAPDALAPLPPARSFPERRAAPPRRSNAEMARDILELVFRMESGRALPVLTRFEGPVRWRLTGAVPPSAAADMERLSRRLRAEAGIDIAAAPPGTAAAITVQFLPRRQLQAAVPQAACFVVPNVSGWEEFLAFRRTERTDWTRLSVRTKAAVFVPSDISPQEIRDCLHEEVAQALGPLNDLYRLPDSVFNDDNFHAVLTGFDMLVLRAIYAPELRSGMTEPEVAARLPALLARLNPAGERRGRPAPPAETPRDWVQAIETALGPRGAPGGRLEAARRAVAIAEAQGWRDVRAGFSFYALGRLATGREPELALASFLRAAAIFRGEPGAAIHAAHAEMQLAAHALASGQPARALALADANLAAALEAENAALLSTLLMIRAVALEALGRPAAARAARLDSLAWGSYGFGAGEALRARLGEIEALGALGRGAAGG